MVAMTISPMWTSCVAVKERVSMRIRANQILNRGQKQFCFCQLVLPLLPLASTRSFCCQAGLHRLREPLGIQVIELFPECIELIGRENPAIVESILGKKIEVSCALAPHDSFERALFEAVFENLCEGGSVSAVHAAGTRECPPRHMRPVRPESAAALSFVLHHD